MDNNTITAAIIGGTGLNDFQQGDIVGQRETPFGQVSSDITVSSPGIQRVAFLARHGNPHSIAPHQVNYRANLWALKQLGVKTIVAVNAVGGIRTDLLPGTLVLPDQLIDYTYGRAHTYYDGHATELKTPLEHCEFSSPLSQWLRTKVLMAAQRIDLDVVDKAVYGVTQGPRLETAAEIDRLEKDGCNIVGMTLMPEAALARELGLEYASICLVVNPAAGRSEAPISMQQIQTVLDSSIAKVRRLLTATIEQL